MHIKRILRSSLSGNNCLIREYLLSSPVTQTILERLSHGTYSLTGYQYLSPLFAIEKPEGICINGILHSPVIQVRYPLDAASYAEDYLLALLSIIPDPERPESIKNRIIRIYTAQIFHFRRKMHHQDPGDAPSGILIVD